MGFQVCLSFARIRFANCRPPAPPLGTPSWRAALRFVLPLVERNAGRGAHFSSWYPIHLDGTSLIGFNCQIFSREELDGVPGLEPGNVRIKI